MTGLYKCLTDGLTYEIEVKMVGKGKTKTPEYWMKCLNGTTKDPKNEYIIDPEIITKINSSFKKI